MIVEFWWMLNFSPIIKNYFQNDISKQLVENYVAQELNLVHCTWASYLFCVIYLR